MKDSVLVSDNLWNEDIMDAQPAYPPIEPGKEFRILKLLPAPRPTEDLVCELETAKLLSPPEFEALSYVWGETTNRSFVNIRGERVGITTNLDEALRALRDPDHDRVLWVDALCIRQDDLEERSKHVKCMKEVYAACIRDLLWLGSEDSIIANARQGMIELGTLSDIDRRFEDPERQEPNPIEWRHFLAFFEIFQSCPVWNRIWIMQEVSFAPEVQLLAGHTSMSWTELEDFLDTEQYVQRYGIPDAFHAPLAHEMRTLKAFSDSIVYPHILAHQRRAVKGGGRGLGGSLLDVLARFRHAEATDARDKIYGLLGLCSDTIGIQSNYALSLRDVYIDCSVKLIEHSGNLDLLCQGPWEPLGNQFRNPDLPSWCPDYEHPGTSRILFAMRHIYAAGTDVVQIRRSTTLCGALSLEGYAVDELTVVRGMLRLPGVQTVLHWMPDQLLQRAIDKGHGNLADSLKHDNIPSKLGHTGDRLEDYWRTLSLDSKRKPSRRLRTEEIASLRGVFERWLVTPLEQYSSVFEDHGHSGMKLDLSIVDSGSGDIDVLHGARCGWRFAVSREGLYCMVPRVAQPGDHIAVLAGAKVPVILRPRDAQASSFTWLGTCYVHGFMDGEALDAKTSAGRKRRYEVI
ncbi:hypothetical protein LTR85_000575 [Meristemomyces frigidus]|nr:hypothetical protein LTR85_000575 [Meristemomyces frigidus]